MHRYGRLREALCKAVTTTPTTSASRRFPTDEHTYPISDDELAAFRELAPHRAP